jgi:hypothetical protein
MFSHRIAVVSATVALVFIAERAPAQGSTRGPSVRFPVTVALVDSLPVPGVSFVVQRRADLTPADLILVRVGTNPAEVSDAIRTLITARQASGDLPATTATIRMRPQQRTQSGRREFPWSPRVLADLRRAPPRTIPGVGNVRAVDIWLPSQARRSGQMGPARWH